MYVNVLVQNIQKLTKDINRRINSFDNINVLF